MRRSIFVTVAALSAIVALAFAGAGQAASSAKKLKGTVGPGFTITINKKKVKHGKYTIVVNDRSSIHNWHIRGPGVNKSTSVSGTGKKTFKVKLKKGTYTIVCDPHSSSMRTTLKVT